MTCEYIVCGKLDNRISLEINAPSSLKKITLYSRKIGGQHKKRRIVVSANKEKVWFEGRFWDLNHFFQMLSAQENRCILVLTHREYLDIVEKASSYNINVDIFEGNYPFISEIKYSSNLRLNYDALTKHVQTLARLGFENCSVSNLISKQYWRTIKRKIQLKTKLDRHFFFAYKAGYQEVFKFKEERSDRVIVALDFNSMYVDCMKGQFCKPSSVLWKDFSGLNVLPEDLASGIYRVRLLNARNENFINFHPFRYVRFGRSWSFKLREGDTVETLLFKDELVYFARFFETIEIMEGIFSEQTIEHPLLQNGISLYKERMYHRRRGDHVRENLCKTSMQHLHSASNQKGFAKKTFATFDQVKQFLSTSFQLNFDSLNFDLIVKFLVSHKYFSISPIKSGYLLKYLNIESNATIFSLSGQIVANARLKVTKTIERFLNNSSVELCYVNTDSIHLSIPRDELNAFLESNKDIISNELGALKIEAIADCGYWFGLPLIQ